MRAYCLFEQAFPGGGVVVGGDRKVGILDQGPFFQKVARIRRSALAES